MILKNRKLNKKTTVDPWFFYLEFYILTLTTIFLTEEEIPL